MVALPESVTEALEAAQTASDRRWTADELIGGVLGDGGLLPLGVYYRGGSDPRLSGATATRSTSATYVDVNGILQTAAIDTPRFAAYYNSDGPFLLDEGAKTNLYANSNALSAGTGNTVTSSAATGPDGTTSAQRIAKTDATTPVYTTHRATLAVAANTQYSVSRYFKYDGYNTTVSLEYNVGGDWNLSWVATFAVASTGITANAPSNCTSNVERLGTTDWYRCSATFTTGAAPTGVNPDILTRITGASGVTVLTYGGQCETLWVTSYFPTSGGTAARGADVIQWPISFVPRALTMYIDAYWLNSPPTADQPIIRIGSGSDETLEMYRNITNQTYGYHYTTVDVSSTTGTVITYGQRVEASLSMTDDGKIQMVISVNAGSLVTGALSGTSAVTAAWSASFLRMGADPYIGVRSIKLAPNAQSFYVMRRL